MQQLKAIERWDHLIVLLGMHGGIKEERWERVRGERGGEG